MLFFLRKLIEALLLPIGFSALLVLAGVILRRRWLAVVGVITLYTFSTEVAGRLMMRPLERVYSPMTVAAAPHADAIVVLNGDIVKGVTAPGVQWGRSANRFFSARDLALAQKANVIVISAGLHRFEGTTMRQTAILDGISPDRIVLTPAVATTEEEALAVSAIPGIHSILLVTSAFHMPRAVLLFRARGLEVIPFPTAQRVIGRRPMDLSEFIPRPSSLESSEDALREYYGLAVYRAIFSFRPA